MTLKPDMDALSALSLFVGIACILLSASLRVRRAERNWLGIARCKIPAYILTAIVFFWSTLWLYVMPLGFVVALRPLLPILFVVVTVLTCIYCRELLMCRAIGGLLVLLPTPLLSAAAWHPSSWRYVMICFAYIMVVEGMFVVGMPWVLRNQISWMFGNKFRYKLVSLCFAIVGVVFVALSFSAYRLCQ